MVGKRAKGVAQVRGYIKARLKLGIRAKDIFKEVCNIYGYNEVSYMTVTRWIRKFKSGQVSIKDGKKSGRPRSVIIPKNIRKIKEILNKDARYTTREIARLVGISSGSTFSILKKIIKVSRISARWKPHLLTPEQKRCRVSFAKKLLKMYPKYDCRQFSNVVTGDETWVHYFEPRRKINNKIWATKHG